MYYLAHPLDDRKMIREWQLNVEKRLPQLQFLNPFYGPNINRPDIEEMDRGERAQDACDPATVVSSDIQCISKANGMVVIINDKTRYGTPMEIIYGYKMMIPIYLIVLNGRENHPWLVYHATKIFTSLEQFETWFKNTLT